MFENTAVWDVDTGHYLAIRLDIASAGQICVMEKARISHK